MSTTTVTYTVDVVRHKLKTDTKWVEAAILRLFDFQTADEQNAEIAKYRNGKGFNGSDARRLSYYAKWIKSGRHLSGKHLEVAHKRVPKYASQILELINSK